MKYRGYEIAIDKDFDGNRIVYVLTEDDGGDPIEVIGASVSRAKKIIDEMIEDMNKEWTPDPYEEDDND